MKIYVYAKLFPAQKKIIERIRYDYKSFTKSYNGCSNQRWTQVSGKDPTTPRVKRIIKNNHLTFEE